jgi:hypothetical protein
MNTSSFDEFEPPSHRAEDDPVEDEHGWATYLNTGPLARFFPVTFPTGVVVDEPNLRCVLCGRAFDDVRGRVRQTAAAAVIEAAALCPHCNDVTACDVRIRPDGHLESLHGLGLRAYANSVHVPAVVRDPATGETVMVEPYRLAAAPGLTRAEQSPLRRLTQWVKQRFWD